MRQRKTGEEQKPARFLNMKIINDSSDDSEEV